VCGECVFAWLRAVSGGEGDTVFSQELCVGLDGFEPVEGLAGSAV